MVGDGMPELGVDCIANLGVACQIVWVFRGPARHDAN